MCGDTNYRFETYDPADPPPGEVAARVDVVAFSAYNFGGSPYPTPQNVYNDAAPNDYIDRMALKWPGKPIFIAETGACSIGGDASPWISAAYSFLVSKGVSAVNYYNTTTPRAILDSINPPGPSIRATWVPLLPVQRHPSPQRFCFATPTAPAGLVTSSGKTPRPEKWCSGS